MSLKIGLQRLALPTFERLPLRCASIPTPFRTATRLPRTFPRLPSRPLSRPLSTATASIPFPSPASASTSSSSATAVQPVVIPRSLPNWLFGCSALVFGIVVIGGLTRLTESGLSITEWEPFTGILPPISNAEWDVEWEKYRVSPEGIMTNSKIEMSEFKKIFYMEWAHRIAGRVLGVAFIVPTIYYCTRYKLPRALPFKLAAIGLGIGFQGVIGWYMVKSGLDQEIIDTNSVPRVSQYRLAAHLAAALTLYVGIVSTAIGVRRDMLGKTYNATPAINRFRRLPFVALGMVFFTAVSGAFVAGLDAGLVYNEFPTMGGRLVPPTDELLDKRYSKKEGDTWWRNMLENPVTAQFDHRVFAMTTFAVLLSIPFLARRANVMRNTQRWANGVALAAVGQVTLGITTLLYLVPIPLAASHQAGSVVLLTTLLGLLGTLRKPGSAARAIRAIQTR
ncbi:putative cytochrome c oxidase biogenesis-related protein [Dioszegia hungarica]|uniref:Cytochrome c oxidase biogenesis-related protein n=1 Tax=Dioszegia hungarica TaxID=4972 RepID=A0AA38LW39_9TREE|nr:putative cytochrome c oxidase biogenesis-related protein [Dioszegia hungarica]KAI9637123.1 putative cytochrome c oxidase biogenesis-related protein [Dioszegia hungarica]